MDIQQAYDNLAQQGGGILPLTDKIYEIREPLNIHSNNVRIIGSGRKKSIILASACNAIEVTQNDAVLNIEGVTIQTRFPKPLKGIGVLVHPQLTVDLKIQNCEFETMLNAIRYRNHPDPTSLGNIVIRNCRFFKSSTKTPRDHYYDDLPHKVMLWGAKSEDKIFDVSYNEFRKHPKQRKGAIELCIWGDPTNGIGNGPFTLRKGLVIGNTFDGATRECLAVSDHQKFVVAFNDIKDSERVGLYVIRGYRSDIFNNVVRGSAFRGHRLANLRECLWSWNEVYDSGIQDNAKVGVGGMHISYSYNNVVTNNVIKAAKGFAVAINNGSSGNYIANNEIIGDLQGIFVAEDSGENAHDFEGLV